MLLISCFRTEQSISMQVIHRPNCGPRCIHSRESVGVLRRGEARITRIALAIVWLFIFCHMWRLIPNAYEFFFKPEKDPDWLLYMIGISHTLIVFNSAVNVLLYKVLWMHQVYLWYKLALTNLISHWNTFYHNWSLFKPSKYNKRICLHPKILFF